MKHAFLIIAHRNLEHVVRLAERVESKNHFIYIHVDKKVDVSDKELCQLFGKIKSCRVLIGHSRRKVNWGGFSQISVILELLKFAYKDGNDYYHLISGQDYFCASNTEFDTFFEHVDDRSFMHYDTEEEAGVWIHDKYPERYMHWYANDGLLFLPPPSSCNMLSKTSRLIMKLLNRYVSRRPIEEIRAGWQWFSWHKQVVEYVLDYLKHHHSYLRRFRYTSCCDELFFHTMLGHVVEELNIETQDSKHFVEWHPKRPYDGKLPLILKETEYDEIVSSKAFFCRKIEIPTSNGLLDLLDKRINV